MPPNRPAQPHHQPAPAGHAPQPPKKQSKLVFVIGVVSIVVIALTLLATALGQLMTNSRASSAVKSSKYQAVFLSNNMVYFGQITDVNERYVKLKDIYYLQVQQQNATGTNQSNQSAQAQAQGQFSLTKLGNELHGPEDEMFINRDQILFWENLKDNSKVTNAIQDYKNKNTSK